jgi:hypothetical protein
MLKDPVITEKHWLRPENFRAIRGLKDDCEFYEASHRNGGWDHLREKDMGFRVMRNACSTLDASVRETAARR